MGRKRQHNKHLPRCMYQRASGAYYAVLAGKAHGLGRDFPAAMQRYAELVGERRGSATMRDVFDRYQFEILPTKAVATQRSQIRQMNLLRGAFGEMAPAAVQMRNVKIYRDHRGQRSKVQANRELALLSHVFTLAIEWELVRENPCKGVMKFTEHARRRYVTDAELRRFMALAPDMLRAYVVVKLLTGARQGDLLALRKSDLTDDGIRIADSKTSHPYIVGWSPALGDAVRAVLAVRRPVASLWLFSKRDGQRYTSSGFQSTWQRVMRRYVADGGERFHEHDLRAKTGSDAENLQRAQELLNHCNPATTRRHYERKARVVRPLR